MEYEIFKDSDIYNPPGGEIISKSKVFQINDDTSFDELVGKYKKCNPRIGNMFLTEQRIKFLTPFESV